MIYNLFGILQILLDSIPEKRDNISKLKIVATDVYLATDSIKDIDDVENSLKSFEEKLKKRCSYLEIVVDRRNKFISNLNSGFKDIKVILFL